MKETKMNNSKKLRENKLLRTGVYLIFIMYTIMIIDILLSIPFGGPYNPPVLVGNIISIVHVISVSLIVVGFVQYIRSRTDVRDVWWSWQTGPFR